MMIGVISIAFVTVDVDAVDDVVDEEEERSSRMWDGNDVAE